ncbi:(deoxy)nucleoside triphosphate pyrophosphohydrolase [Suttonella ornithocola]|uniref:8-oxo-dGTP diphosphatase n=1 Tax=Suttonella ornithocola TaxID=279832 RepID=A0A380MKY9_9GAMM|nr:(deoxy)nucleoside triphosphate pyrophosphohydrolase [Suttonella ornithocola]SUO93310.1 8-oxo-dGTP diphosphatase [Suttonella ornithocola]
MSQPLSVAAGILMNAQQEVLIAERPQGKAYAGYWEFPGGKIETGESAVDALVREFQEELGIDTAEEHWQVFYCGSRAQEVNLTFLLAQTNLRYSPKGLENQRWKWVSIAELSRYQFPEPNTQMLKKLQEKFLIEKDAL